jgi:hypothetical protein
VILYGSSAGGLQHGYERFQIKSQIELFYVGI